MHKSPVITMTIGTLGVVIAGAVAGLAVYKVASNSTEQPGSAAVVAALPASPAPPVPTLAPLTPADLPEVPVIATPAVTTPAISTPAITTPAITKRQATQAVLKQAPGATVKVTARSHQGYSSWAVQVQRTDGSIVTGYVDQASGVIFDWSTDRAAPASGGVKVSSDDGGTTAGHDDDSGSEGGRGEHESGGDDD
jgi:hypothetical protein